eukprot:2714939-Rhodomonas_salina.2
MRVLHHVSWACKVTEKKLTGEDAFHAVELFDNATASSQNLSWACRVTEKPNISLACKVTEKELTGEDPFNAVELFDLHVQHPAKMPP